MEDMVRCEDWCLAWGLPKLLNPGSEWENNHDYFTEGPLFTFIIYCYSPQKIGKIFVRSIPKRADGGL